MGNFVYLCPRLVCIFRQSTHSPQKGEKLIFQDCSYLHNGWRFLMFFCFNFCIWLLQEKLYSWYLNFFSILYPLWGEIYFFTVCFQIFFCGSCSRFIICSKRVRKMSFHGNFCLVVPLTRMYFLSDDSFPSKNGENIFNRISLILLTIKDFDCFLTSICVFDECKKKFTDDI